MAAPLEHRAWRQAAVDRHEVDGECGAIGHGHSCPPFASPDLEGADLPAGGRAPSGSRAAARGGRRRSSACRARRRPSAGTRENPVEITAAAEEAVGKNRRLRRILSLVPPRSRWPQQIPAKEEAQVREPAPRSDRWCPTAT